MNDPLEGVVKIEGESLPVNSRELVYCSCWSAQSDESISMWGVYGKFDGVRIKIRSDLFADFSKLIESADGFFPYGSITPIDSGDRTTVDKKVVSINGVYGPIHIKYMENEQMGTEASKTDIGFETSENGYYSIKTLDLGNQKNKYWQYEDEWRYKITAYSDTVADKYALLTAKREPRKEHIDIPFRKRIEEITLGPLVSNEKRIDLETFLSSYGYDRIMRSSAIKMR